MALSQDSDFLLFLDFMSPLAKLEFGLAAADCFASSKPFTVLSACLDWNTEVEEATLVDSLRVHVYPAACFLDDGADYLQA